MSTIVAYGYLMCDNGCDESFELEVPVVQSVAECTHNLQVVRLKPSEYVVDQENIMKSSGQLLSQ